MAGNSMRNQKQMDAGDNIFSRRDSIAVAGAEFQQELYEKLSELRSIWNEVGMTEDQRRERMETALNHLKSLLSEMVDEENCMRETLQNAVVESKKQIELLLVQLREPKPDFLQSGHTFTLLEMEEKCRNLKDQLTKERDARIGERDALLADYARFSLRLGLPDSDFNRGTVPNKAALDDLKREVDQLKKQWEINSSEYLKRRPAILKITEKIQVDRASLTPFQAQALVVSDPAALVLSRSHMMDLAALEKLLQEKYEVYLHEIRERINIVEVELIKWWEQCHVPLAERERFETVDPETDPEKAVEQYNEAIGHWRAFYESRKTILDKIGEWERLWQEHVEFEERERDANRYNNRGGALLQEEKRRKKVQALLPQVYKQLSVLVTEYDNSHPEGVFLMDGMPVMQYIDSIQYEYQEKKRKEKEEKELLKKQQLMVERLYGAMPNTPGTQKKKNAITPSKSPSKKCLLTVHSQSKYVHSSLANTLRSPGAKLVAQSAPGSSTKKPPTGLPIRAQAVKRKVLMDNQGSSAEQLQQQGTDGDHSTVSSTASYGEFVKVLRTRGGEVQSSFIGTQARSPSKVPRME